MDLSLPFRGSAAVASGAVGRGALGGRRFRRVFPDVYVAAGTELDLATQALAAGLWAGDRGVVAGYAAAELLDASCGPPDAAVDVIGAVRSRAPAGIRLRRVRLGDTDVVHRCGVPVTSPLRTAFDLARWADGVTERVAAVDTIAHVWRLDVSRIRETWFAHLGAHGSADLAKVLALVDPRSESPMESRIRMALHLAGLPPPCIQYRVGGHRLDLAYPSAFLGVEHDGGHHREPAQARADLVREAELARAGWRILRFPGRAVVAEPEHVVAAVRAALIATSVQ
ncbi:DUF559 domain-containing protein [Pseudonocardia ailaonensis]|uniref:DUF559 domain-containing protein n=1 Tax=Pseudonocardia ailaonensis TaxID=367279 RepID=A0ABN2NLH7_9PSEU